MTNLIWNLSGRYIYYYYKSKQCNCNIRYHLDCIIEWHKNK